MVPENPVATDDIENLLAVFEDGPGSESGVFGFQLEYSDLVGNQGTVITTSMMEVVTLDTIVSGLRVMWSRSMRSSFTASQEIPSKLNSRPLKP